MQPNAPTKSVWLIALVVGFLGLIGHFIAIPYVTGNEFWLVSAGFVLLVLSTFFKNF